MKTFTRAIISFHELGENWQKEARRNLAGYAEEALYLEPEEGADPEIHVLWDLTECMPCEVTHGGVRYNACIGITNNSDMLLKISDCGDEAEIKFV